jgi:DNA-binding NarL/FixJ family response regulator
MPMRRALLVEDDALILFGLEMVIEDHGMEIAGSASTLAEAELLADSVDCDIAVLDVNLHGEMVFPAADILIGRGIPIVFSSGYALAGLPSRFADVLRVGKPYDAETLWNAIEQALKKVTYS